MLVTGYLKESHHHKPNDANVEPIQNHNEIYELVTMVTIVPLGSIQRKNGQRRMIKFITSSDDHILITL